MALPASAQDFRGLLPGMPASALAAVGEPFRIDQEGGITAASYPLPFERTLDVIYADGTILFVALGVLPATSMSPPASSGLQVGESSLDAARTFAGSDGFAFDVFQSLPSLPPSGWRLSYTLPDHPGLVLYLSFYGRLDPSLDASDITRPGDAPQDAVLISATLTNPTLLAQYPNLASLAQTPPPDTTPFARPLSEAFPLIALPQ
ncbi:hypothetical protein [Gymnodinialimonas ulvae]|uniref:hypothetical protein n=1 Tax=Gymnodinialimonas ulvae TaxID=3126504 RepID=UPI0030ED93AE